MSDQNKSPIGEPVEDFVRKGKISQAQHDLANAVMVFNSICEQAEGAGLKFDIKVGSRDPESRAANAESPIWIEYQEVAGG
jgi:hypothetical protein